MSPWKFIPSLYFMEGLPYCILLFLPTLAFKDLGVSNSEIAIWTSLTYLPWVIKPLWSPLIDAFWNKKSCVTSCQALLSLGFIILGSLFLQNTLSLIAISSLLLTLGFFSATHDVAADGLYILSLPTKSQSFFSGIRNTSYRLALIFGQGGLVLLTGYLLKHYGKAHAWAWTFYFAGGICFLFSLWHQYILPNPETSKKTPYSLKTVWTPFKESWSSFFRLPGIASSLAFLLLYRLGEGQMLKLASPFFMDSHEQGGLGLNLSDIGVIYGVIGVWCLLLGGLLGGFLASKRGYQSLLWPMWAALNLPNLLYVVMAMHTELALHWVGSFVAIEQFGYGFGFTGYMLFMLDLSSQGKWKTSRYALCTGFMALGMMLPGMISGHIQALCGYPAFFMWVCLCSLPSAALISVLLRRRSEDSKCFN